MPEKYHIHTHPAPARFAPIPKFSMIEKDGCLGCLDCIKDHCVYRVYDERTFDPQQMIDTLDTLCMSCLRCIQGCKKRLITRL
jgi:TPP-dependent indolepyruvate ferredoxin oxidoreductase alpha subunit